MQVCKLKSCCECSYGQTEPCCNLTVWGRVVQTGWRIRYNLRALRINIRDYICAVREYPQGALCEWCGDPNFFFDDCGWFAITPDAADTPVTHEARKLDTRVCCRACWNGPLGNKHVAYFGLGER